MMLKAAVLVSVLATGAAAQTDPLAQTKAALEALTQADRILTAAETQADQRAALNQSVTAFERSLQAIREGERDLKRAERKLTAALQKDRAQIARLATTLMRMQQLEEGAMLIHPGGLTDRIHAALAVERATPRLKAATDEVAAKLSDLAILREALGKAETSAKAGLVRMRWAREQLRRTLAADPAPSSDLTDALATVAATSRTLDLLIEGIAALEGEGLPINLPSIELSDRFGQLPLPVEGTLISGFGSAGEQGEIQTGATIVSGSGAFVRAPFDATIRYVGPFLGYGNVIILEPAPDILLVLAGMKKVYVKPEEIVSDGAVLGEMPGDTATDWPAPQTETLYVELRRGGSPVDPAGWFSANKEMDE